MVDGITHEKVLATVERDVEGRYRREQEKGIDENIIVHFEEIFHL